MTLKIQLLVDSETLFSVLIRNASSTKKRLLMDVKAAREMYNNGLIDDVIWRRREYNLADAKTKDAILLELITAIEKNQLNYEVEY